MADAREGLTLQVLREADLVLVTDRGRERVNALNASALYQATIGWLDPGSARTAHALDSLKRLAEAPANTAKEQTVSTETFLIEHLLVEQGIALAYTSRVCGADAATGTVRIRVGPLGATSRVTMRQEAIGAFEPSTRDGVERGWASKLEHLAGHCAKVAA